MVTIVPVPLGEGSPRAPQGSSEDLSPRPGVYRHHSQHDHRHHHHHGLRHHHHFGRRHHHHHHLHHGPYSRMHRHGHGDHSHHGSPYRGLRGRHGSRGLHDIAIHGHHGPHCRRRLHRSLSPRHLMHDRSREGSFGSPHRGHRGHRDHREHDGGRHSCGHHSHHDRQALNPATQFRRSPPLPSAIEQGIEQLGQLSLRS